MISKAVFSLPVRAAMLQWLAQYPRLWCCALIQKCSRAVLSAKSHRCDCADKQGCFQLACKSSTGAMACTGSQALVLCIKAEVQQSCEKFHRCECTVNLGCLQRA